jgi:hypothetical protein
MKICLLDVFLVGIVILFACLFRKTEGMDGAPISPEPSPPNTQIQGILSDVTKLLQYFTHLQTRGDITDVPPNPSPRSYYNVVKGLNKVPQ